MFPRRDPICDFPKPGLSIARGDRSRINAPFFRILNMMCTTMLVRSILQPENLSEISRAVQMSMSSCFNILKTLVHANLLSFDPKTKKYALETLTAQFFAAAPRLDSWARGLGDQLRGVASRHRVSCGLWQVRGDRQLLQEVFDSPSVTRVHLGLGQRIPLYAGATGRCVVAIQRKPRRTMQQIIGALRWQLPPPLDEYEASVQHVLDHGWSLDRNNHIRGLTSVAAPIRAGERTVRHCITATSFSGQHDDDRLAEIGEELAAIARRAEQRWIELIASETRITRGLPG
jgi:DNA-binding IclR family transcriptional regulator